MRRAIVALVPLAVTLATFPPANAALPRGWENVGPVGGEFISLEADPVDAAHVAVLADAIRETRDGGATWRQIDLPCSSPQQLKIRGDFLYLNCGYVIKHTRDRGETWEQFSRYSFPVRSGGTYGDIFLHPGIAGVALVAGGGYQSSLIEITSNDGATWNYTTNTEPWPFPFKFQNGTTRLFGLRMSSSQTRLDFVESSDWGSSWSLTGVVAPTNTTTSAPCFPRDMDRSGQIVYATTDCGVAISRDGGVTWEVRSLADVGITFLGTSKVLADPQQPRRVAIAGGGRIVTSTDMGQTWSTVTTANEVAMAMGPDGTLWTDEWGRISRYNAFGKTAAGLEQRFAGARTIETAGSRSEVLFTTDSFRALLRSGDGGATWSAMPRDAPPIETIIPVSDQPLQLYGVAGQFNDRMWFSRDAGLTWETVAIPSLAGSSYVGLGNFQPLGPQPGVIYAELLRLEADGFGYPRPYGASVVRSVDGGLNWKFIAEQLPAKKRSVSATPADPMTAYVGTEDGYYRTRDAGATWQRIWTNADQGNVSLIRVDRRNPMIVYLVKSESEMSVSEDGGDHWRQAQLPGSSGTYYAWSLVVDSNDAARAFFVSVDADVFETRDAARSWTRVSVGATPGNNSLDFSGLRVAANGASRNIVAVMNGTIIARNVSAPHPTAIGTDLWWNPQQPGWGLSIAQHDNFQMFAIWYTYDANGKPRWFFMPGGTWSDNATFRSTLYSARTAPGNFFASAFDPASVVKTAIGDAILQFSDTDSGTATFTFYDGARVVQPIQRMAFGAVDKRQPSLADLWWNPAESGWGMTLHQQYSNVFVTWFLFDAQGESTWLTVPDARLGEFGVKGFLYRAQGAQGSPYSARDVVNNPVGTFQMTTDGFVYSAADGALTTTTKTVSRLPF